MQNFWHLYRALPVKQISSISLMASTRRCFLPRLARFARLSRITTVVTFDQPPRIALEVVSRDLLQWVDHVVLVSPSQLPFFVNHVPRDRIHVILHGIDDEFFRPAERPRDAVEFRCITVGHWLRDWTVLGQV